MSRGPSSAAPILAVLALTGVLAAGAARAATSAGSVNFTLGGKILTRQWDLGAPWAARDTLSLDRQPALGVELTWGRPDWPVRVALDVHHSYDDGVQRYPSIRTDTSFTPAADVRRRARTIEVGLGARRSFAVKGFSPYLGAGAVWVWANLVHEMSVPTEGPFGAHRATAGGHKSGAGFWAGGGIYRRVGPRLQIGLTGRYSRAKLSVPRPTVLDKDGGYYFFVPDSAEVEAGGLHVGLLVGWSFPAR